MTLRLHKMQAKPLAHKSLYLAIVAVISIQFVACSFQEYAPKPIDAAQSAARFSSKSFEDSQFQQFLIAQGYAVERLPIQLWHLDDLTYCALFFHPSLEVARTQWRSAQLAEQVAGNKPLPTLNSHLAHSDDPDPAKKPFALGLGIDIPIEVANKRLVRIEQAQHLTQIAKLEIAQTAWQLRHQLAQTFSNIQYNQQQISLLAKEKNLREAIVKLYQKRLTLGEASNIELSNATLQLQSSENALLSAQQAQLVLQSQLASQLGLPLAQVNKMALAPIDEERHQSATPTDEVQATALQNRIDIRIALERYAAAEAKLKLEIANQYPDLVISPGYTYEFGDNVWSLGISSLLALLNKNKTNIAAANQLREVEAAQFDALQIKVIQEANTARAQLTQASAELHDQQQLLVQQRTKTQRFARQFAAGEIDRLTITYAELENVGAEKALALARYKRNQALDQLENTMQKPITTQSLFNQYRGEL
ncbi:MAG TPA: TolC family protein [Methylophilaceae bacterium]|nr:TolC family protein [Methylophilaceae bacterium]